MESRDSLYFPPGRGPSATVTSDSHFLSIALEEPDGFFAIDSFLFVVGIGDAPGVHEEVTVPTRSDDSGVPPASPDAVWTMIANMRGGLRGGADPNRLYTGTRLFSPGTRLYLGEVYWGMADSAHVVGRAKDTKKLVNCVVKLALLEKARPKRVYSPSTIHLLRKLDATLYETQADAARAAERIARTIEWLRAEAGDEG